MNATLHMRASVIRILLTAMAGLAGWLAVSTARAEAPNGAPPTAGGPTVNAAVISIDGEITEFMRNRFIRQMELARSMGAKTIIVNLDTYGGLVLPSLEISQYIKAQTDLHTIAFVNPKAISGGSMIALACDEVVMSTNGTIGDCAPIIISTNNELIPLPPAERAKEEGPILADFYDSAKRNHHDPLLCESMVLVNSAVYWVAPPGGEGQRRMVDQKQYEELSGKGWRPVDPQLNPLKPEGQLLTIHTGLAVDLGLASGRAADINELASQRNLHVVREFGSGAGEALIEFLSLAPVRVLLLILFIVSLFIGLHAHGHGAAEAVSLISLGALLLVPLLTGYAQWWQIGMVLAGLALLAMEIFVFPTAGAMAFLGVAMMGIGFVLTFAGREPAGFGILPKLPGTWTALERGLISVVIALVCSGALCAWISRYLPKIPLFKRLVLTATSGGTVRPAFEAAVPSPANPWPPVGSRGRALSDLLPGGRAEFYDEVAQTARIMSVVCEDGYAASGTPVEVREVGMNRVVVRVVRAA